MFLEFYKANSKSMHEDNLIIEDNFIVEKEIGDDLIKEMSYYN